MTHRLLAFCAVALLYLPAQAQDNAPEAPEAPPAVLDAETTSPLLQELMALSARIDETTTRIEDTLRTEEDAEQIFDEQISIMRDVLEQMSEEGDFGGQLEAIEKAAANNLTAANASANPRVRAIAPRFEATIDAVRRIRGESIAERSRGMAAIREIEDEREVVVMLIRARALEEATELAQERLNTVRQIADRAVEMAQEVEDLSGGASQ